MTIFTNIVVVLNLIWFTIYMRGVEVDNLERSEDSPYVDVTMASGEKKRTKNIVARVMKIRTMWIDKTPEEKTAIIVRNSIFASRSNDLRSTYHTSSSNLRSHEMAFRPLT